LLNLEKNGEDKPNVGILMMIFASICFTLMAVAVHFLKGLSLAEIIFFRNLPIMLVVPLMLKRKKISFWGNNKPLLMLRSLLSGFVMVAYFYYSITAMNLTDAVTIKQLSPFFIILLAGVLLGEKISFKLLTIFILAFLGALLVVKPGFRSDIYPAVIGLSGAILTAGSHVALRQLKKYRYQDYMTPYEKLRSIPHARAYLKESITFERLDKKARKPLKG